MYQDLLEPLLAESMHVVSFPTRQARSHYRHELFQLTYVVLDASNGGIIRNLNSDGVSVQAVAPPHPQQRIRMRFELKSPKVRVETYGQVSWVNPSGQCGIRFMDLPAPASKQIDEWIFSSLIEAAARHALDPNSIFAQDQRALDATPSVAKLRMAAPEAYRESIAELSWLSRPLSGKTLARTVDGLLMLAALLLFVLIFISLTHDLPQWPLILVALISAIVCVAGFYWGLFAVFGAETLGTRMAQAAEPIEENMDEAGRFR
jgi:hypothetical protein